ncbi:MAG TPA: HAD-IB family hydrolase [Turneriella sp.]|nr:HAD-IB family hydrolase [Turneriella sp.]
MSPTNKPYIAFFDLDETLLSENSGRIFWNYCFKNGYYTPSENMFLGLSLLKFILGVNDTEDFVRGWAKVFNGWSEDKMLALAEKVYHEAIQQTIRPLAVQEIKKHQDNAAQVVILSASTPYVCNPVAQALNVNTVICTRLEIQEGTFTGNFASPYVFGEQKYLSALQYANEKGIDLQSCYYYGDAHTDRFVMEAVGLPVCVTPDKKLRTHAQEKNWPILMW